MGGSFFYNGKKQERGIFMEYRVERDSMGEMKVPADVYWGAQTQRSYENFRIGSEKMPPELIRALGMLKKAAAMANYNLGKLDLRRRDLIIRVCDELEEGRLDGNFPLSVWQTGSGTQTNMNVNEVIANRGNRLAGESMLHPNDHVNMSQSSNDVFPSAMHLAAVMSMEDRLLPALSGLTRTLRRLEEENRGIVKTGRTHLQDATPIGFSQEISGWREMTEKGKSMIEASLPGLRELALGGTAVGTGLNTPRGFSEEAIKILSELTDKPFIPEKNKFHGLSSRDALVFAHGALKALAANMMKMANDIRWLASGPRCGLGEITIPENEPGSSIMPGKVNPTQCEAMTMIAVQVMGNDTAVGLAASQGNFELNVFMPVCIYNFLQSVNLLADGTDSFCKNCVSGIKANRERMDWNLHNSLMLVTALNPYIGYDNGAKTAKKAYRENISLRDACAELGFMSREQFAQVIRPEAMI
jgi:fumarate hydratase class II